MLGDAKPYFTLIAESPNRDEIERVAAEYERKHPGEKVVIDCWRDHVHQTRTDIGTWRARVKIPVKRSLFQKLIGR
jgi:hypothetical protein